MGLCMLHIYACGVFQFWEIETRACLLQGKKWEKVCKGGLKYGLREKWTTEGNRRKRVYQVERSMRQHRSPKYIFGIGSNLAVYQSYQVW